MLLYLPFSKVIGICKVDWCVNMKNEHSRNIIRNWVLIDVSVCHRVGNVA